jgi:hypothetical protein
VAAQGPDAVERRGARLQGVRSRRRRADQRQQDRASGGAEQDDPRETLAGSARERERARRPAFPEGRPTPPSNPGRAPRSPQPPHVPRASAPRREAVAWRPGQGPRRRRAATRDSGGRAARSPDRPWREGAAGSPFDVPHASPLIARCFRRPYHSPVPARQRVDSRSILRDPNGVAAEQLGMRTMPTSFLIDSGGVVGARGDGFREEDQPGIDADVRALSTDRVLDGSSHAHIAATMDGP